MLNTIHIYKIYALFWNIWMFLLFIQPTHVPLPSSPVATSPVALAILLHMETPVSFTVTLVEGHRVGKVTKHVSVKLIARGVGLTSNVQVKSIYVSSACVFGWIYIGLSVILLICIFLLPASVCLTSRCLWFIIIILSGVLVYNDSDVWSHLSIARPRCCNITLY